METLLFFVLFSVIHAMGARRNGRDFLPWRTYLPLLTILAPPHALLLQPEPKQLQHQRAPSGSAAQVPESFNSIRSPMARPR